MTAYDAARGAPAHALSETSRDTRLHAGGLPGPCSERYLARGGQLRKPVAGTPDSATGEPKGLAVDLVDDLARRLSVPRSLLAFDGAARVFEAGLAGAWDIAFLAIVPVRTGGVDFTPPFAVLEGTYVVRDDSPFRTALDLDQPRRTHCCRTRHRIRPPSDTQPQARHASPFAYLRGALDLFLAGGAEAIAGLKQPLVAFARRTRDCMSSRAVLRPSSKRLPCRKDDLQACAT